jgi:hypothetical protein
MAVQPKLERLLSQLNQTGLQKDNPALFQVISQLIKYLMQSQEATGQEIVSSTGASVAPILSSDLLTHDDESAIFPNSRELLAGDRITFDDTVANERTLDVPIDEVVLTGADESGTLPNSRQLLAGTGISFDDSVDNERTVNNISQGSDWDVLSDGDVVEPEIIFADGEVIMLHIP